jgi:hypothetical protein
MSTARPHAGQFTRPPARPADTGMSAEQSQGSRKIFIEIGS